MKLKSLRNKPILIEFGDVAMSVPPHKIVDIGTNYSASIDRAIKLKDVMVVKEEKKVSPKSEKKDPSKNSQSIKDDKDLKKKPEEEKEDSGKYKEGGNYEDESKGNEDKEEGKNSGNDKKRKKRKSGLKTVKDLLNDNNYEDKK